MLGFGARLLQPVNQIKKRSLQIEDEGIEDDLREEVDEVLLQNAPQLLYQSLRLLPKQRQRHGMFITAGYASFSVCAHTRSMLLVIMLPLLHGLGPQTATLLKLYVKWLLEVFQSTDKYVGRT